MDFVEKLDRIQIQLEKARRVGDAEAIQCLHEEALYVTLCAIAHEKCDDPVQLARLVLLNRAYPTQKPYADQLRPLPTGKFRIIERR